MIPTQYSAIHPSDTFDYNFSFGSPVEAEAQQNRPILNPSCKNTLATSPCAALPVVSLSLPLISWIPCAAAPCASGWEQGSKLLRPPPFRRRLGASTSAWIYNCRPPPTGIPGNLNSLRPESLCER